MAENSMNQEGLTLEETNKMRIKLGLKPIGAEAEDGEEPPVDEDEVAEANFAQRKQEMKKAKEESDLKERIAKARNQRDLNAKLKGSTLGDVSNDDGLDAKAWLKKQKKRAKQRENELAARRAREQEELDKAAYGEEDLAGLKVGHGAADFEAGEDVILTLKDSRVLAGEEDELQNIHMVENEALAAVRERKRKAQAQYTGFDDEEFDEDRIGKKADILSKYDDEYATGKIKSEGFRLGVASEKKPEMEDEDQEMITLGHAPATKVKLNLDFTKDFEVSDYMKEGDKGFKQRKKKRSKPSGRRVEAEEADDMQVDGPTFERRRVDDGPQNLVDDDDIQAALSRARRANAKTKPKVKAEDIAAQGESSLGSHAHDLVAARRDEDDAPQGDEDGRITFDDTSEFVRNVTAESRIAAVKKERAATPPTNGASHEPVVVKIERDEDGDQAIDSDSEDEDEVLAEMAARENMSIEEYRLKMDQQMQEVAEIQANGDGEASDEPAVTGNGLAGILSMLRNQGALKKAGEADEERERVQKQKDLWLADYRRRMAQREMERIQARGGNKDQAQREWEARVREQNEARDALELYKNYKPDINIVYHDEFGRQMTPKEAWKSLSHKFHGKTSGRMKTEKRLKRIAEERKQATMGASDTPLGMSDAFSKRQHKTGLAHMVLTTGNRQAVQAGESKPKIRR
ncbi:SART-1 protein [Kockovaella imperatae]|uniref:SART-1 protein n=1 Tax=Kockovaella imperatae TaxID=4999 RepID=A0A1Y1UT91_9TREE|nr:SART-1 protein [Kockovaella imperatae]ORX40646.1 SART-1 protein [Kockovaella imperatae]